MRMWSQRQGDDSTSMKQVLLIIHSVNFFPNWAESELRAVIERALGGIIDDCKPQPRYMHGSTHRVWEGYEILCNV